MTMDDGLVRGRNYRIYRGAIERDRGFFGRRTVPMSAVRSVRASGRLVSVGYGAVSFLGLEFGSGREAREAAKLVAGLTGERG